MAGIYGVLLKNQTQENIFKNFYNANFSITIGEEIVHGIFRFGRSVSNKFEKDRFLFENDRYIICYEGINYSKIRSPEDFIEEFEKRGKDFVKDLKGTFAGFIFDKTKERILVYNDPLSTRRIFYYYDHYHGFAFASEMHVLSRLLRDSNISLQMDRDAIYSLALYGQLFDEMTTVCEIKKLGYGSTLEVDLKSNKIQETPYYRFIKKEENLSIDDAIEGIDTLMTKAIADEWNKDKEYGYEHIGLISGGMDSRVNTMIAAELGFENIKTYTYGSPDSSDVQIAQKIAADRFDSHLQYNFQHGRFYTENVFKNYIRAGEGMVLFTAHATIYNALKTLNLQPHGILHSGQIGDVLFGSFLKPNFNFIKNKGSIGLTGFINKPELLEKIGFLEEMLSNYNHTDFEIYAFEQRQVNGTLMGDHLFNNFIDLSSPFYNTELIDFCLNIPNKYKTNQSIYFKWMKTKHPDLLNYRWEKIGLKPNSDFKINYGRLIKKYVNGGKKYLGWNYDSMSPISTWFKQDPTILGHFDRLFKENIGLINDVELQNDLTAIYQADIFEYRNKFSVLSALLGVRLHVYDS